VFSVDYWLAGKLLGNRSTKRLVLESELRAQRLLELKPVHIRIMDTRQNDRGFIRSTKFDPNGENGSLKVCRDSH
jgi:hypothetical protein